MHLNHSSIFHQENDSIIQDKLVCLVLTDFPENIVLKQIKKLILQEFAFVHKIQIKADCEIQCYFESMTDLVELDQGKKYGAGRAFIRQIEPELQNNVQLWNIQKTKGVIQNSTQTLETETCNILPSFKFIPFINFGDKEGSQIDRRLLHNSKTQRLTSLEDVVQQLQNLREGLDLFQEDVDQDMTFQTQRYDEKQHVKDSIQKSWDFKLQSNENPKTEIKDWDQQSNKNQQNQRKQLLVSLLEGAALTGLILGGVKFFKNLLS